MGHLAGWPGYRTVMPGGSSRVKKPGDRKSSIRDLPIYTEIIGELSPQLSSLSVWSCVVIFQVRKEPKTLNFGWRFRVLGKTSKPMLEFRQQGKKLIKRIRTEAPSYTKHPS